MRGPHTEKTKKIMSLKKKGKPCDFIKTKFKKGHIPWNKYLTKETDERLAYLEFLGFKKGHKTWNKNLTKEIDERIKGAKKFNEEQIKEIIFLYGKNSITQIVKQFKCSPSTILSILKENSVEIKPKGFFKIGKKQSEETVKKRSLSLIGRKASKKAIARLIQRNLTDNPSKRPEVRAKLKITRAKQITPVKDTKIELKIQDFLTSLKIEFVTHKYMNIKHSYQCDILIPSLKLVIECDGDFYHMNPNKFSPEDKIFKKGFTAEERWELDNTRTRELIKNGYKVIRLWGSEIKKMELHDFQNKINYVKNE